MRHSRARPANLPLARDGRIKSGHDDVPSQLAGLRVQKLDPDFRRGDGMGKRPTNYRIPGESRNARYEKTEGKP